MRRATIALDRFGQAQRRGAQVASSYRAGMQQLGFQINDVATQLASGTRISTIFAQQSGQVIQAIQLMSGGASRFAQFMGGPWGVAMTAGAVVLLPLIARLFDTRTELEKATDQVAENARKTELNRLAQEAYARTLPGVIDQIRQQTEALRQQNQTVEQSEQLAISQAQTNAARIQGWRDLANSTIPALERAIEAQERANRSLGGLDLVAGTQRLAELRRMLQAARAAAELLNRQLQAAQANIRAAEAARIGREVNEGNDPLAREAGNLRRAEADLLAQYQAGQITRDQYRRQLDALRDASRARTEQINRETAAQRRLNSSQSDGVSRFRSRQQAIGVAGRELQGMGFHVGENVQFGGVRANHTFSGHGQFAIDVNIPGAGVEANDPASRERMEAVARSYQARGYRVLWNGRIYEPGGNGPGPIIPRRNRRGQGISDHRNHLHLEAPASIVGRPTGSGAARELQQAQRDAEQRAQNEAAFQDELARLNDDLLEARRRSVTDAETLANFAVQENEIARERRNAGYMEMERRGRLSEAQREQLVAANNAASDERKRAIQIRRQQQLDEQRLEIAQRDLNDQQSVLQARAQLARTAMERREIELRLLELQRREELLAIERNRDLSADERARAVASVNVRYGLNREGVLRSTAGPLGSFLDAIPRTAAEANEALQAVAAEGLKSIEDAIVGVIMGTQKMGQAFKQVAASIIADLIRIQLQRSILGPLANALGGLFGGGVASLGNRGVQGLLTSLPGRAAGGPVLPGRTYVVGEKGPELLQMGGTGGYVVANDNIGGGQSITVHQTFEFRGVAVTQDEFMQGLLATKDATMRAIHQANRRRG